jgi:hypothetical protein
MKIDSDQLYVVRLPEIHAAGHVLTAILTAEFGQLEDIKAKHSSMEVVSVEEYPEYIAEMIRRAVDMRYKSPMQC